MKNWIDLIVTLTVIIVVAILVVLIWSGLIDERLVIDSPYQHRELHYKYWLEDTS